MSAPRNTNFGFVILMVLFGAGTWWAVKWVTAPQRALGAKELKCPFYQITYDTYGPNTVIRGCGRSIAAECTKKQCVVNPGGSVSAPGDFII